MTDRCPICERTYPDVLIDAHMEKVHGDPWWNVAMERGTRRVVAVHPADSDDEADWMDEWEHAGYKLTIAQYKPKVGETYP